MTFISAKIQEAILSLVQSEEKRMMLVGSGITFTMKLLGTGLSYVALLVIARWYGPYVTGSLALALVVYNVFSLPGARGARDAIIRLVAESTTGEDGAISFGKTYQKLLIFFLTLSSVMGALLLVGSEHLSQSVFKNSALATPFRLMGLAVPIGAISFTNAATLRGLKRMAESAFVAFTLPAALNASLIVLFFFVFHTTVETVVLAFLVSLTFCATVGLLLLKRQTGAVRELPPRVSPSFRRIASVSLPMFVSSGMILVLGWTDTVMLGMFRPAETVGIYRVAFKVAALSAFTLDAVGSIAAAQFAVAHAQQDLVRLRVLVIHSSRLVFWGACPVILLLSLFSRPILGLFGDSFADGIFCLRVLTAAQAFSVLCGLVGMLLNICGGQRQYRNIMIAVSGLNIALNAWLVPRYGITGATLATATSLLVGNLLASLSAMKLFGFWPGFRVGLLET